MIIPPSNNNKGLSKPLEKELLSAAVPDRPALLVRPEPGEELYQVKIPWQEASEEAEWVGQWVGDQEVGEEIDATTDHAWLVVLGHFAQALGLVTGLEEVSLKQRQGPEGVRPQTKLIEFLVGILGGLEYLQDLNEGSEPIAKDPTIAEAWAQAIFRHYSQVSRTLEAADEETLATVLAVLCAYRTPSVSV